MLELPAEISKQLFNKLRLLSWHKQIIKVKLLNDQIEIVQKCLFNILGDARIKTRVDVLRLIASLNFLDPEIQVVFALGKHLIKAFVELIDEA